MSSKLRSSSSSSSDSASSSSTQQTSPLPSPSKKQKMSLAQTYYFAHTARGKLSKEASRADHDLRLLVGHANLLDSLMIDLADAEQEQESWFNQTVKTASSSDDNKHIEWASAIPEEATEDDEWDAESSDSDSEYSDAEEDQPRLVASQPLRNAPSIPTTITTVEIDADEEDDTHGDLALARTSSIHPPELLHESDSEESDEDSAPPSPPDNPIGLDAFSEKQRQAVGANSFFAPTSPEPMTTSLSPAKSSFFDEAICLAPRDDDGAMVTAY